MPHYLAYAFLALAVTAATMAALRANDAAMATCQKHYSYETCVVALN